MLFRSDIDPGRYTLVAKKYENNELVMTSVENITIESKKTYDIILFPAFEDETLFDDDLINLSVLEDDEVLGNDIEKDTSGENISQVLIILVLVVMIISVVLYLIMRKKDRRIEKHGPKTLAPQQKEVQDEKSYDSELRDMIEVLRRGQGKLTQKQLRKRLPYSEAKVSMMISILEKDGVVRKIKRGRGNILVLRK